MNYNLSDNFTWKDLGEKVVVLNLETSEYFTLNETASLIWKDLSSGKTIDEIIANLSAQYDADPAELRQSIEENLDLWLKEHALVVAEITANQA
jgi:hypothetical protein